MGTKQTALPLLSFISLLFMVQLCSAVSQDVSIDINATSVTRLIAVNASFGDMQMIPGYEYSSDIIVDWAVPNSALSGIAADKVAVFVKARMDENSSQFYFKDNGIRTNETFFTLNCAVSVASCSSQSKLSQTIRLYTTLTDIVSSNRSGTLWVLASLKPFEEFEPIYNESIDLGKEVDSLRRTLTSLNISDTNKTSLNQSLDDVQSLLNSYHVDEAKAKLDEIKPALGVPNGLLWDLSLSLSFLETGLGSLLGNIPYLLAFMLGVAVFLAAVMCKLRLGTKAAIVLVALAAVAAAFMRLVDAPLLIVGEVLLGALPLAILCFWRKKSGRKPGYRENDD